MRRPVNPTSTTGNGHGQDHPRRFRLAGAFPRSRPDGVALLVALFAALGTLHVLIRTSTYGAAVSADSTGYLSAAMNLLAGLGLVTYLGGEIVYQPPLFPMLLAFMGLFGIEPLEAGRLMNAAAFGLTILVSGLWLRRGLRSPVVAVSATLAILAAHPLNHYAATFLTDTVFILLTLLALIRLESFLRGKAAWPTLLWAAGFASLTTLLRYAGVTSIFTGVLLLLLVGPGARLAVRLKRAAVFGAVASIPLAAVLVRNWLNWGELTGQRSEITRPPLADSLGQVAGVLNEWAGFSRSPGLDVLLWAATGLTVLAAAAVAARSAGFRVPASLRFRFSRSLLPPFRAAPALPFGVFAPIYAAFIVITVPAAVDYAINSRYMLPVYVPLLLTGALLLDRFVSAGRAGGMAAPTNALASLMLAAFLAHAGLSAQQGVGATARALEHGYVGDHYNTAHWSGSELLDYVKNNRIEGRIFSNYPSLIWFASGMPAAAPDSYTYVVPIVPDDLAEWLESRPEDMHIVWFRAVQAPYRYDDSAFRALPGVETVAELSDGVVFRRPVAQAEAPQEGSLQEVQATRTQALQEVQAARTQALQEVQAARTQALQEVQTALREVETLLAARLQAEAGQAAALRRVEARQEVQTLLYALEREVVPLDNPWEEGGGGAIASLGDDLLLVATPKGRIAVVHPEGEVDYLQARVPMNVAGLERDVSFDEDDRWSLHDFRVADVLLKELSPTRFELYVTHHYFTGECNRLRLSSTSLHVSPPGEADPSGEADPPGEADPSGEADPPLEEAALPRETVVVEPAWRTVFDAEPCRPPRRFAGSLSGGKMLTDGPGHLLVIIGDHDISLGRWGDSALLDDPGTHMGKLVRVAIETGAAETLTTGHRNPQGLARDGNGNLWAVEHGPVGGDELNLLEPGRDYGWPKVSLGVDFSHFVPSRIGPEMMGRHGGFSEPVFAWVPAIVPTSIVVNDERTFPLWRDDLLVASLTADSLFRIRRNGRKVQYVEPIPMRDPIRDLAYMPDGRLALLHASTTVLFLKPSMDYCEEAVNSDSRSVYAVHCSADDR